MDQSYQNWQVNITNNIVWLYFNRAERSVNTFNHVVLNELQIILTCVTQQHDIKGLVITSAKSKGFIAGADIEEFGKLKTQQEALNFIKKGQTVFAQLAALPVPTIALINGFCMGGGLELALACQYRVATDDAKTRLGLPEVLLGLHPGWGGTVRLPRLVGATRAMDMILTGRTVSAQTAEKMGLVDIVVPARNLERAALHYIIKQPKPHQANWLQRFTNHTLIRPRIAMLLRRKVAEKASPEHYPAPFAVIDQWEKEGVDSQQAFAMEAESLAEIALTDTAHNLIRTYFLKERLKNLGKQTTFDVQHVHVIGAGTMGGDIAAWCALQGLHVTLQDREPKLIQSAIKRAYALFQKKLKSKRDVEAAMDRLTPDVRGYGVAWADVIIEAIFENLEAKQALFKQLEQQCKPEAVLATNTSSIPLDEINRVLQKPERLVGIHFFNPVALMPLVEVVQGAVTATTVFERAVAFVHRIEHLPLPVKSAPGFLVNRVLMPYLLAAINLLEENIPAAAIDKAAIKFGMPMGPIELADTVGLDVCLAVANELGHYFGKPIPERLTQMVAKGELGRKTEKGFYQYKNGKPVKDKILGDYKMPVGITDRLIQPMIEEAQRCLAEGVVVDSDLLDAGMIFGIGFAPFRGGLLHYAATQNA